ncbi:MAG: aldo/keto reductase [Spirochaetales bacterium]|nr:aldo/keto reductase [Spirochaetales bacterium]
MNESEMEQFHSTIGLSCGGMVRLGKKAPFAVVERDCCRLLRTAYEEGIRFFDLAYPLEEVASIKEGLSGIDRSELCLSTNFSFWEENQPKPIDRIQKEMEEALVSLDLEYFDISYVRGIAPEQYDPVVKHVYPLMEKWKREGLVKKVGISENFSRDHDHHMMGEALSDSLWDVLVVGYNILNQSASSLLKEAKKKGLMCISMSAIKQAFVNNEVFGIYMDHMIKEKKFHFTQSEFYEFKDELFRGADGVSFPGLAYRFVRDEDLFDVILTGTGNNEHLMDNIESLKAPALSNRVHSLLKEFFKGEILATGQEGFMDL